MEFVLITSIVLNIVFFVIVLKLWSEPISLKPGSAKPTGEAVVAFPGHEHCNIQLELDSPDLRIYACPSHGVRMWKPR